VPAHIVAADCCAPGAGLSGAGLIALLSIVLLAITLLIRLRTTRTCQLTPQAGPSSAAPR
jgi:hypothetical protein